jgi:hypothetical protein
MTNKMMKKLLQNIFLPQCFDLFKEREIYFFMTMGCRNGGQWGCLTSRILSSLRTK